MTDTNTTEDLELFDEARKEFPSKYDLKDRLVAIWVTGKTGTEKGENSDYTWVETITLVLDDPKGVKDWNGKVKNENGDTVDTLVAPVHDTTPQRMDAFRWSAGGFVARLKPRINLKDSNTGLPIYRPMIGRVDEKVVKGKANPWTILEPTDADKVTARKFADQIRAITLEVKAMREGGSTSDTEAFE